MTKRLMTIISGQPLPNYIAINELKPDVVHCICTPQMRERLDALKKVAHSNHPNIVFFEYVVPDSYDSLAVGKVGISVLDQFPNDDWHLNRSAGTEQMRAPLTAAFFEKFQKKQVTFFVESEKNQLAWMDSAWNRSTQQFKESISVIDYFLLHGQTIQPGGPQNKSEQHLLQQLRNLNFDDIKASCKWYQFGSLSAEFDCAATYKYRLFVFERKVLENLSYWKRQVAAVLSKMKRFQRNGDAASAQRDIEKIEQKMKDQDTSVQHDIEKLAYTRAVFGGPYGQVYWLLTGNYVPKFTIINRMKALSIKYLRGDDINKIVASSAEYGLPPRK